MADHFWYSEEAEVDMYMRFAQALEWGHVSRWDIPHKNTCWLTLEGEEVEVHYNFMAKERDVYEKGMRCELGWRDVQYLGEGRLCRIGANMTTKQVAERLKELGHVVPSVLVLHD